MTGTTLSHYRIEAELGRGGMGIVYRARDTKLDRAVALKVLPASALTSEDDRARFYREAKAAAALNHPNIAAIHQIDEAIPEYADGRRVDASDGPRPFIAMEFIEGGTLEARIKEGPLKIADAVRLAIQIANALQAAHAKHIVHRDIKSANIMLTPDGQAKVLDFGLAQTAQSTKLTRMGSTLGTIAYMSPEQARGEEVDGRSDLYSLGTVLYEMIAGRLPFGGAYEQAVVYSILNADPEPLTAIRTGVPMELEQVVNKALRKDAGLRYQTAADFAADLKALDLAAGSGTSFVASARPSASTSTAAAAPAPRRAPQNTLWPVATVLALVAGMLLSWMLWGRSAPRDTVDIALGIPGLDAKINSEPANASDLLTISPDGNKVAYVGSGSEEGLFVQDLTTGEPARRIARRGETPAFSPDSRFIAFSADGAVYRAGLAGDAPERLATGVTDIVGLSWADDGHLYYAADYATGISRVRELGGPVETVTQPDRDSGDLGHVYPDVLPGGKTMLFTAYGLDGYELRMMDLASGRIDKLGPGVTPHFIAPDIVVFAQGPRLLAARLDVDGRRMGPPVVISESIYHNIASFSSNVGVSQRGDVVFIDGSSSWNVPLEIRRWDGTRETVAPSIPDFTQYSMSRDGRYIVMTGQDAVRDPDIWVYDLQTKDTRQITDHPLYDAQPLFSSDGRLIWFASERSGPSDIYTVDVRTGEVTLVYADDAPKYVSSVSADDTFLLYLIGTELWALDLVGDAGARPIQGNVADERESDISPDSRWIAFSSETNGQADIFVVDYPETRPRQRITVGGGRAPKWSADGRFVYYKRGTELYRVPISPSGNSAGPAERVMEGIYERFELLPDGSGILVRATPPRRTVRYIQDVVGRMEERLVGR
jgi:Tol biopolymer transport system component